jgi:hypothetical protein
MVVMAVAMSLLVWSIADGGVFLGCAREEGAEDAGGGDEHMSNV